MALPISALFNERMVLSNAAGNFGWSFKMNTTGDTLGIYSNNGSGGSYTDNATPAIIISTDGSTVTVPGNFVTETNNTTTGYIGAQQFFANRDTGAHYTFRKTDETPRWAFELADAESTGNAGANLVLRRYADDGTTSLGLPLTVNRATGNAVFANALNTSSVGIGLSSTAPSYALHVQTADSYTQAQIENVSTTNPAQLILRNTGNGNQLQIRSAYDSSPTHDIFGWNGSAVSSVTVNYGTVFDTKGHMLTYDATASAVGPSYTLSKSRSNTTSLANDVLGEILFKGTDTSNNIQQSASITAYQKGAAGATYVDSRMVIASSVSGTSRNLISMDPHSQFVFNAPKFLFLPNGDGTTPNAATSLMVSNGPAGSRGVIQINSNAGGNSSIFFSEGGTYSEGTNPVIRKLTGTEQLEIASNDKMVVSTTNGLDVATNIQITGLGTTVSVLVAAAERNGTASNDIVANTSDNWCGIQYWTHTQDLGECLATGAVTDSQTATSLSDCVVFTAPLTGRYVFRLTVVLNGLTGSEYGRIAWHRLDASNKITSSPLVVAMCFPSNTASYSTQGAVTGFRTTCTAGDKFTIAGQIANKSDSDVVALWNNEGGFFTVEYIGPN